MLFAIRYLLWMRFFIRCKFYQVEEAWCPMTARGHARDKARACEMVMDLLRSRPRDVIAPE